MGKNSRRRHIDKQRRAVERQRRQHSQRREAGPPTERTRDERPDQRHDPHDDGVSAACEQLELVFGLVMREWLWARGWQPDELVRQVRRSSTTTPASIDLLATVITSDAVHHDRVGNAVHASWRRQTGRIAAIASNDPDRVGWLARWLTAAGDGVDLSAAQALLDELLALPALPTLIPPPGSTDCGSVDLLDPDSEPSPVLAKVRALLAKAESTDYPAEAEAFTVKAQALMAGARLDEVTVRASSANRSTGRAGAIRIALDEPYVVSKRSLLQVVAEANDVRCVFSRGVGLATAIGPVQQLAHVELLFTSLLIQVQGALTADAASAPAGSRTRSRRYRSSFIIGFARRIGERLQQARAASLAGACTDALPVLAADDRATAELFERLVGATSRIRSSAKIDSLGVEAGAGAADRAALSETGLDGSGRDRLGELPEMS